jgi:hypothetical protein
LHLIAATDEKDYEKYSEFSASFYSGHLCIFSAFQVISCHLHHFETTVRTVRTVIGLAERRQSEGQDQDLSELNWN